MCEYTETNTQIIAKYKLLDESWIGAKHKLIE